MKTKKIAITARLLIIALVIGVIEAYIPPFLPALPYAKLGLGNIVMIFCVYLGMPLSAFIIVVAKSFLIGIFTGSLVTIIYSLGAGLVSFLFILIFYRVKFFSIPAVSAASGIIHNVVQITISSVVISSKAIFLYLPYLATFGSIAGYIVGILAYYLIRKFKDNKII